MIRTVAGRRSVVGLIHRRCGAAPAGGAAVRSWSAPPS
jgi:hypothetical protein